MTYFNGNGIKFILGLITTIVLLTGCATHKAIDVPKYQEFIAGGTPLPITQIDSIDGGEIRLDQKGKKKLVILFATWCSDSNRALEALNQSDLLLDDSIEIIAIAREQTNDVVAKWRDEKGIKVTLASDPDRSIYKQFAAAGIPRFVTVDENNQIIKMNLAEGENQLDKIEWD
jgi:peroxiredoxin